MPKEVTIESVLRDYYHAIPSENLSEDKITIDEELEIPDSKEKYIIRLAIFLNECYYKGYTLSGSILKRLMDVIDYEGYEYQILESYINILNKAMIDHNISEEVKPDFANLTPDIDTCRAFVTTYAEAISDSKRNVFNSRLIPHFKSRESDIGEDLYILNTLKEIENPIQYLKEIFPKDFIDILHVFYKADKQEFLKFINIEE